MTRSLQNWICLVFTGVFVLGVILGGQAYGDGFENKFPWGDRSSLAESDPVWPDGPPKEDDPVWPDSPSLAESDPVWPDSPSLVNSDPVWPDSPQLPL